MSEELIDEGQVKDDMETAMNYMQKLVFPDSEGFLTDEETLQIMRNPGNSGIKRIQYERGLKTLPTAANTLREYLRNLPGHEEDPEYFARGEDSGFRTIGTFFNESTISADTQRIIFPLLIKYFEGMIYLEAKNQGNLKTFVKRSYESLVKRINYVENRLWNTQGKAYGVEIFGKLLLLSLRKIAHEKGFEEEMLQTPIKMFHGTDAARLPESYADIVSLISDKRLRDASRILREQETTQLRAEIAAVRTAQARQIAPTIAQRARLFDGTAQQQTNTVPLATNTPSTLHTQQQRQQEPGRVVNLTENFEQPQTPHVTTQTVNAVPTTNTPDISNVQQQERNTPTNTIAQRARLFDGTVQQQTNTTTNRANTRNTQRTNQIAPTIARRVAVFSRI